MPIALVKQITKQLLLGLTYIHDVCKVIHTDIKPENVMVYLLEDAKVAYLFLYLS
jgi:serine/threonine-protein kinase SRPK3